VITFVINWRKWGMRSHESGPGFLCDALAIIRDNDLSGEHVCRHGKCQVIGHSVEVTVVLALLHADCLEQESLPLHVHTEDDHFPLPGCHLHLPNLKLAPFVQAS
jgi:hypothetical protein